MTSFNQRSSLHARDEIELRVSLTFLSSNSLSSKLIVAMGVVLILLFNKPIPA